MISLKKIFIARLKNIEDIYKKNNNLAILDIGCGNHSAKQIKSLFPLCKYYGVDKDIYNNDQADIELMEKYYHLDLEKDSLNIIPDDFFDVIILSHVIEHINNGDKVVDILSSKLKNGGIFYIEFPSVKSLGFPSMRGTLNFCDDESHVRLYTLEELCNILLANNFKIVKAGVKRDLIMIVLMPLLLIHGLIKGEGTAGAFWDLLGFANYIIALKK